MQENRLSSGVSCGMTVDHDRNVEWIMTVQRERERERELKCYITRQYEHHYGRCFHTS